MMMPIVSPRQIGFLVAVGAISSAMEAHLVIHQTVDSRSTRSDSTKALCRRSWRGAVAWPAPEALIAPAVE